MKTVFPLPEWGAAMTRPFAIFEVFRLQAPPWVSRLELLEHRTSYGRLKISAFTSKLSENDPDIVPFMFLRGRSKTGIRVLIKTGIGG